MKRIILASASPRRKQLLKNIGLKFDVKKSNYKENLDLKMAPIELAKFLSREKAKNVAEKQKDAIIIAADTFIVFQNKIIGKPFNRIEAKKILRKLNGQTHLVITGFTILDSGTEKTITKAVRTNVFLKKMSIEEINNYVATNEPLDKAGAYGIQKLGGIFIEKIEGDYFNVVGLPICELVESLKEFNVNIL